MHEMSRDHDKWYCQDDPPSPDRGPDRQFTERDREHQRLERNAAYFVIIVKFCHAPLWSCRDVWHFNLLKLRCGFPAAGKRFLSPSGTGAPNHRFQVSKKDLPG